MGPECRILSLAIQEELRILCLDYLCMEVSVFPFPAGMDFRTNFRPINTYQCEKLR